MVSWCLLVARHAVVGSCNFEPMGPAIGTLVATSVGSHWCASIVGILIVIAIIVFVVDSIVVVVVVTLIVVFIVIIVVVVQSAVSIVEVTVVISITL